MQFGAILSENKVFRDFLPLQVLLSMTICNICIFYFGKLYLAPLAVTCRSHALQNVGINYMSHGLTYFNLESLEFTYPGGYWFTLRVNSASFPSY